MKIAIIIIIVIVILIGIWVISIYNSLQKARVMVDNQWGQIQTEIEKRFSLIPNLVNTVKGYAKHEATTLEEVIKMRSNFSNANKEEQNKMMNTMSQKINQFLINVEQYPDLKANQNFLNLQEELQKIEEDIALQRKLYNDAISTFNMRLVTFPTNIVAKMLGFKEMPVFAANDAAQTAPVVNFE